MKKKALLMIVAVAAIFAAFAMIACSKDISPEPTPTSYTVTYDLDGGKGTLPTETPKSAGETFTLAKSDGLSKDGFVFDKWSDGVSDYAAGTQYTMPEKDIILKVKWKLQEEDVKTQKTVRYENIDGTGMSPVGAFKVGEGLAELPTPEKAGNTFDGWFESSDFSGSAMTTIPASRDTDVVLYAKWTANSYNVVYDNKAGSAVALTQGEATATYGEDYNFSAVKTSKIPVTVTIKVGGIDVTAEAKDGVYTLVGNNIVGDIAIELTVNHVQVIESTVANATFDMDDIAEMGRAFAFNVTAERGYKITAVTVTDEDGARTVTKTSDGYSAVIGEKAVTVTAAVSEISYKIQYVYDTPTTDERVVDGGIVSYNQTVTLPNSEAVAEYTPQYYEFKGWKVGEDDLTAGVSQLTDVDGATVEIYAVLKGERHTVTLGSLKGFDVNDDVSGNAVTVYYGEDLYLDTVFDNVNGYATEWTVTNGVQVKKSAQCKPYIEGTAFIADITISGENFVAPSAFYDGKTSYDIPDVFDNNNEYHVVAALGEDGLYFRAVVKQHSLDRSVDGVYFSIGNHEGTTYYNKDKSFHHYGINANGDNHLCDRYVVKVDHRTDYYDIVYEGFVAYETFIYEESFGYSPSAFAGSALDTAEVFAGMRIINKANLTTEADTVLTLNAQSRLERASWDPDSSASLDEFGVMVNADGRRDMDFRNAWKIKKTGMTSTVDTKGVDGVISENEYAGSVIYTDTKTDRHNKMEIYAEHKDGGIKIGMRITSLIVTYSHNEFLKTDNSNLTSIDLMNVAYYKKGETDIARTMLLANGRYFGNFEAKNGFITAVGIDKSHAGNYEKRNQNNGNQTTGTGLKAEGEDYNHYFVTTYELFIPDSYTGYSADDDVQVMIQHRHQASNLTGWWWDAEESGTNKNTGDALSFEHCSKWTSVWQYSPTVEDPGMWATNLNYTIGKTGVTEITSTVN